MGSPLVVIVLAVVFTAVLSIVQGLYWAYVAKQEREQEELIRRLSGQSGEVVDESLLLDEAEDSAASALGNLGEKMHSMIVAADAKISVTQFLAYILGGAATGMVVGGIALGFKGMLLAVPLGYAPYYLMESRGKKRGNALVSQLPDALDLMSRSLQAGLGLNDAFKLVAEEMPMPVAGEFGRVFEEVRFGRDYREAFGKMIDRNPGIFDLRLMVSSILLQRETGGNLIEILENIAGTIRARFGFQAKVRAMTAEAKFSALILGSLPMGVMAILTVSNPDYLNPLFEDRIGNFIIAIDLFMYGMGIMIMRDMIDVKV